MLDIDELERLARAASPGEWIACGRERGGCACGQVWAKDGDHPVAEAIVGAWGDEYPDLAPNNCEAEPAAYTARIDYGMVKNGIANAAFIAAANPATVLALIEKIRTGS